VAKGRAIRKLLPYAESGDREGAACVLKKDGTEFDFKVGDQERVALNVPEDEACAIFHSHPNSYPHSAMDFMALLGQPSIEDSYLVCRDRIYCLRKPQHFSPVQKLREVAIEDDYEATLIEVGTTMAMASEELETEDAVLSLCIEATSRLAQKYGLEFYREAIDHATSGTE